MRSFINTLLDLPHDILHRVRLATSPSYRDAHAALLLSPEFVAWVRSL